MLLDEGIATIARWSAIAQKCAQIALGDFVFQDSFIELGIKVVLGDPCLAIEGGVILLTSVGSIITAIGIESLSGTSSLLGPIRKCAQSGKLALEDGFLANIRKWRISYVLLGPDHLIQDGVVLSNEGGLGFQSYAQTAATLVERTLDVSVASCRSVLVGKKDLATYAL